MATHQHKRPYAGSQPSITSYFPQAISPTSTHQQTYTISPSSQSESLRSPPLPPSVQSNLLSVGMRVRKSVPEGYKTGGYSAFTLFSDDAPAIQTQASPVRNRPRARELTPFCGILKIGGMAQQQWGINSTAINQMMEEEEDDYLPALSQGSTISNESVPELGRGKRRGEFDDEEVEEEVEVARARVNTMGFGERAIAVPRRKKGVIKTDQVAVFGQENVDADFDFGEADFLDHELIDSDMSGV